jgi:hypothetical protein
MELIWILTVSAYIDLEVLLDVMKFIQKIGKEAPLASLITSTTPPEGDEDTLRE